LTGAGKALRELLPDQDPRVQFAAAKAALEMHGRVALLA
jgi:hypothetical protein